MADAPKPMEGIWTLTAPDGRTWQAETPLRCVRDEQAERVPATVRLQRIMEAAAEPATDPAYEALRRLHDWALAQQGDCMFSGDHPIAQAAVVLGGVPTKVPPSHEWLRMNAPEKHAAWAAGNLEPSVVDWMAGWEACRAQVTAVSPAAGLAGALTSGEGASKPIAWAIPQTKQFSWDQQDERWWSPLYLRPHGVRAVPPTNERGVSDAS